MLRQYEPRQHGYDFLHHVYGCGPVAGHAVQLGALLDKVGDVGDVNGHVVQSITKGLDRQGIV